MINTLLKKISNSLQEKDWQSIADIDKQLRLTVERNISQSLKKPEKAKTLMADLEEVAKAYDLLLLACHQERKSIKLQARSLNKSQKASQNYLSIAQ